MVNTRSQDVLDEARAIIRQATATPLAPVQATLIVRTEQDAREAFGADHGLGRFLTPQPPPAIVLTPLPCAVCGDPRGGRSHHPCIHPLATLRTVRAPFVALAPNDEG